YANLLAAAMHKPSAGKAHPSFVNLIQQLSASEARLLQEIARSTTKDQILLKEEILGNPPKLHALPEMWRKWCAMWGVADAALADTYYINLLRLSVFVVRTES